MQVLCGAGASVSASVGAVAGLDELDELGRGSSRNPPKPFRTQQERHY